MFRVMTKRNTAALRGISAQTSVVVCQGGGKVQAYQPWELLPSSGSLIGTPSGWGSEESDGSESDSDIQQW